MKGGNKASGGKGGGGKEFRYKKSYNFRQAANSQIKFKTSYHLENGEKDKKHECKKHLSHRACVECHPSFWLLEVKWK